MRSAIFFSFAINKRYSVEKCHSTLLIAKIPKDKRSLFFLVILSLSIEKVEQGRTARLFYFVHPDKWEDAFEKMEFSEIMSLLCDMRELVAAATDELKGLSASDQK